MRLKPFLLVELHPLPKIREREFKFNEINIDELHGKNICLSGYFQSYKYFHEYFNTIYKLIGFEFFKENVIKKCNLDIENYVSLHFRLGDYKNIPWVHPIATHEYYKSSLLYIQNNSKLIKKVLYFCEDDDLSNVEQTINSLKIDFPNIFFTRADPKLRDWEQMMLMSCCSDNVIANSSFSWWGAYLNTNPNKIVCYPSVWFGRSVGHDTSDLCPSNWKRIL